MASEPVQRVPAMVGAFEDSRAAASRAEHRSLKDTTVMTIKRKALLAAIGLVIAGGAASAASADPLAHPRRAEVDAPMAHQDARLHQAEHRVMQQARFVRHHRHHLTQAERQRLNREEHRINRHIG
jgi:hypothetical protein